MLLLPLPLILYFIVWLSFILVFPFEKDFSLLAQASFESMAILRAFSSTEGNKGVKATLPVEKPCF